MSVSFADVQPVNDYVMVQTLNEDDDGRTALLLGRIRRVGNTVLAVAQGDFVLFPRSAAPPTEAVTGSRVYLLQEKWIAAKVSGDSADPTKWKKPVPAGAQQAQQSPR